MQALVKLFEPGRIGTMELKNRIILAPLGNGFLFATKPDGYLTDRHLAFYEARAKGGVGMIQLSVSALGRPYATGLVFGPGLLSIADDDHIASARAFTDAIHAYGTKVTFQITHHGAVIARQVAQRPPVEYPELMRVVAPTGRRDPLTGFETHSLTIDEIEGIIEAFGQAAWRGKAAGFDAVGVANGETGLARLRYERPDVCVLDLMLPGIDGWRVIEQARGEGIGTPIVVVSARGTEHDRVHALEIGADDYLVKPFSMKELAARVRAAARRGVSEAEPRRGDPIVIEELRLDPDNVQAYVDGVSAELTPTEFRLLYTLAREQGRVLTRDELLQRVWGRRATHRDRTVDVFVRKLREKVDTRAPRHTFIQTRYGVGYKLEPVPK